VRGVGYVTIDEAAMWPAWLDSNLIRAPRAENSPGAAPAVPASGTTTR
jgi:hypothetical protein